jgi:hypothetical protein
MLDAIQNDGDGRLLLGRRGMIGPGAIFGSGKEFYPDFRDW